MAVHNPEWTLRVVEDQADVRGLVSAVGDRAAVIADVTCLGDGAGVRGGQAVLAGEHSQFMGELGRGVLRSAISNSR